MGQCALADLALPAGALALLFGSSFVLCLVFPALFQRFYVKPSELQLETPYIEHNIALTRQAYNLQQIAVKPFPAEEGPQPRQRSRPTARPSTTSACGTGSR